MIVSPGLDWIDLLQYDAFRLALLISFLWGLYRMLKHDFKNRP